MNPNLQKLHDYAANVSDDRLRSTCFSMLANPNYERFPEWPAAITFHHTHSGGLVDHTLEVVEYGLHMGAQFPAFSPDIYITAALYHDLAKIWDYQQVSASEWERAPYVKLVHHINGSNAEFVKLAYFHGVDRETTNVISHAILAHHGRKEWGSPVEPQTLEATILHQADMLSAKYGATA